MLLKLQPTCPGKDDNFHLADHLSMPSGRLLQNPPLLLPPPPLLLVGQALPLAFPLAEAKCCRKVNKMKGKDAELKEPLAGNRPPNSAAPSLQNEEIISFCLWFFIFHQNIRATLDKSH